MGLGNTHVLKKYAWFDTFIFRCPMLPISKISERVVINDVLLESIYLASPDLYEAISKTPKGFEDFDQKIKISVYKYFLRMSSRCTPFGLFAGCGTGKFGNRSEILINEQASFRSRTRLDMNVLCGIIHRLASMQENIDSLILFPNSSLYKLYKSYRYIEINRYDEKAKHLLSEVDSNEYLELVLTNSANGITIPSLKSHLRNEGFQELEIDEFIDTLLTSQILVTDLEPSVTGTDLLEKTIQLVESKGFSSSEIAILKQISKLLTAIDSDHIGRDISNYQAIEDQLNKVKINYKRKYLIQTDLATSSNSSFIDANIIQSVEDGIYALNKLTPTKEDTIFKNFKESFYRRYEDERVPLSEVLDADIGLGFGNNSPGHSDINPLIDTIPNKYHEKKYEATFGRVDMLLAKKYQEAIHTGQLEVSIMPQDLEGLSDDWDDLPLTMSSLIQVISTRFASNPNVLLKMVTGASAGNLLARFGHLDLKFNEILKEIDKKERELIGERSIIAEIVHLPQSRVGNILFRPAFRKYEIPYLAQASVLKEFQIPISDIFVSLRQRKEIIIWSKRLNKTIIPRLTNAHNYQSNSTPIYQFLCLLQSQNIRKNLMFNWGELVDKNNAFFPRVVFKKCVLSPAQWKITTEEVSRLPRISHPSFYGEVTKYLNGRNVPKLTLFGLSDNKLLIDRENELSLQLLFSETAGRGFSLEEFFFDKEGSLIKSKDNLFNNEVVLNLYKNR